METQPNKSKIVPIMIIIIVVLAVLGGWYYWHSNTTTLDTYHEKALGFDIKYPHGWAIQDDLPDGRCCLFVVNVQISTTTTMNASGTPVTTVTAKEPLKIQLGYYYRTASYDPFKMATTTKIMLGKNVAYTGVSNETPFYLIPTSEQDGLGAALFTSVENTDHAGAQKIAESILSTITFTGTTTDTLNTKTGTSTATSTAR